ncbi:MAG: DUF2066 domain-containing protein [Pseudomonadota bacterium]
MGQQILAGLAMIALLLIHGPEARARDVFTVDSGLIEAVAATELAAKEQVFIRARQLGFQTLVQRLTMPRHKAISIDDDAIAALIDTTTIRDEAFGGGLYRAGFELHFNRQRLQNLLHSHGISYVDTVAAPILVLPLIQHAMKGDGWSLWQEPGWLASWTRLSDPDGLVPIRIPAGDATDRQLARPEAIWQHDSQSLAAIAQRYRTGAIMIATARITDPAHDGAAMMLDVTFKVIGPQWAGRQTKMRLQLAPDMSLEAGLDLAANKLVKRLETRWKQARLIAFDQQIQTQTVVIRPDSLHQLVRVQAILQDLARIRALRLNTVRINRAEIELDFYGGIEDLKRDLSDFDIRIIAPSASSQTQPQAGPDAWQLVLGRSFL